MNGERPLKGIHVGGRTHPLTLCIRLDLDQELPDQNLDLDSTIYLSDHFAISLFSEKSVTKSSHVQSQNIILPCYRS